MLLWHKERTLPHRTYWLRSCFAWTCDWDHAPSATFAGSLHHTNSQARYILPSHWSESLVTLPSSLCSALTSNGVCSFPFLFPPGAYLSSLVPFHFPPLLSATHMLWFPFPLASLLLNTWKTCTITLVAIMLLNPFLCFPFSHPASLFTTKTIKAANQRWFPGARFFQHPAQWGPILPYTVLINSNINLFKEGKSRGMW